MRALLLAMVFAAAVPAPSAFAGAPEAQPQRVAKRACAVQIRADDEERPRLERPKARLRSQRPSTVQAAPTPQVCPAELPQAAGRRYLPHYFL